MQARIQVPQIDRLGSVFHSNVEPISLIEQFEAAYGIGCSIKSCITTAKKQMIFATLHADGTVVANIATTHGDQLACVLYTTPLYGYPDR